MLLVGKRIVREWDDLLAGLKDVRAGEPLAMKIKLEDGTERELEVRLRPGYFPFVEPGAEFDIQCPFGTEQCSVCKGAGWIELGGSGMVHPAVLEAVDLDPERYTGWAFGFGIDRIAMLRHGINHLRLMFEGDVRFLEQFPC